MNYLKNYNDYADYVKKEVSLERRPRNKNDLHKNFSECYYEFHHILPRCIGGLDDEENLIPLTAREHFLAHYLLMKIYPDNYKLGFAFTAFCMNKNSTSKAVIYFNSRLYEVCKKNIDFGATSRGKKRSDEFCKKVSEAKKGIPLSDEHKKSVSKNHANITGQNNPMYGKHHSEASKRKISETRKKLAEENPDYYIAQKIYAKSHYKGSSNPRARKIRCIELNKAFDTVKDAAISVYNCVYYKSGISACCKGKKDSLKGYHWEYIN